MVDDSTHYEDEDIVVDEALRSIVRRVLVEYMNLKVNRSNRWRDTAVMLLLTLPLVAWQALVISQLCALYMPALGVDLRTAAGAVLILRLIQAVPSGNVMVWSLAERVVWPIIGPAISLGVGLALHQVLS